uniref:Uncharacterized protein n=1 Tax=Rhizophora mucronata TaxID=61149 RepID=A0A2P2P2U0_RHIMU
MSLCKGTLWDELSLS